MATGGIGTSAAIVSVELLEGMASGPARNRTANPLIKSPLEDTTTADHDGPPPGISEDYEP